MSMTTSETKAALNRKQSAGSIADGKAYLETLRTDINLSELVAVLAKWKYILLSLVASGAMIGTMVAFFIPTYYESVFQFAVVREHVTTLTKSHDVNLAIGRIFADLESAEQFADYFFTALESKEAVHDAFGPLELTRAYPYLLKYFASGLSSSLVLEERLANAKHGLAAYLLGTMSERLQGGDPVPAFGFLYHLISRDDRWTLQVRVADEPIGREMAYATLVALKQVIKTYNQKTFQEAMEMKQNKLKREEKVLAEVNKNMMNTASLLQDKARVRFSLLSLDSRLSSWQDRNGKIAVQKDDPILKALLNSRVLVNTSAHSASEIIELLLENNILSKASILYEKKVITSAELDEVFKGLADYQLRNGIITHQLNQELSVLGKARQDYVTSLMDTKLNIFNEVPLLGQPDAAKGGIARAELTKRLNNRQSLTRLAVTIGALLGLFVTLLVIFLRILTHVSRTSRAPFGESTKHGTPGGLMA